MAARTKTDEHTLLLTHGTFSVKQIETALNVAKAQLVASWGTEYPEMKACTFEVNPIRVYDQETKTVKLHGKAYVWVGSTAVFHALTGSNLDGTPRVLELPDPDWTPPPMPDFKTETVAGALDLVAWADIDEAESKHPLVQVKQDPLIRLPAIEYTPQQYLETVPIVHYAKLSELLPRIGIHASTDPTDESLPAEVRDALIRRQSLTSIFAVEMAGLKALAWLTAPSRVEKERKEAKAAVAKYREYQATYPDILKPLPSKGAIEVQASIATLPDEEVWLAHVLTARDVPMWVTAEMMQAKFNKFNTDPMAYEFTEGGKRVKVRYPRVELAPNRRPNRSGRMTQAVMISFSEDPKHIHDASFARQMRRKLDLDGPSGMKATLVFDYYSKVPPHERH